MIRYNNCEKYSDPTAGEAIFNIEKERRKIEKKKKINQEHNNFTNTLQKIFDLCESEGYHVENRIWLKDMKTGKVRK